MRRKEIKTDLGKIIIEQKETEADEDIFVGNVRLIFEPNLPKEKDGLKLQCFSLHTPDSYNSSKNYEWLFSWYKDGRNVNDDITTPKVL